MGRTEYNISQVGFIADQNSVDYSMGYAINWDLVANTDADGNKTLKAGTVVAEKGDGIFERTAPEAELSISGITEAGGTATATTASAHNLSVGDKVNVQGADQAAYNGVQTVTGVPSATTFTYEVGETVVDATGTITGQSEAVGILLESINEQEKNRAQNGQAVIVGGVIYESLLPDSGDADFDEFKTELQNLGSGFHWEKYADDRAS